MKHRIHLICNAHLDPVWQWEWEEGAAAAVSTFRAAADFCEETEDFIFCHNEVILYRWVEEYEPELFERIRKLVRQGRWRIMGGWYLQPDCNLPSGESILRQMRQGREYFLEKFGAAPTVAVNFDPFGHSRGLVQILTAAGYTGYLFMRPAGLELPANDFLWEGFGGAEILAHRLDTNYNSPLGGARQKAEKWLEDHADLELGMIPWGVGNHGGGPSREDIAALNNLKAERKDVEIFHSTPEGYFADLAERAETLPHWDRSLQPFSVGCYTSVIRIKQTHRKLEGMLGVTERMCAHAAMLGLMEYPAGELEEAERDLCFAQFHDILPGSSIQPVETMALRQMDHALEILSRLRARAFFRLASGEKRAKPGEIPILAYNPHPYDVEGDFFCEFMLADQNWKDEFTMPRVFAEDGTEQPSQVEKEDSNLNLDWRKRVVFHARLRPFSVTRFDCRMEILPEKPVPTCREEDGCYVFENETLSARVDRRTGLLTRYAVEGEEYLAGPAFLPALMLDREDPWEMRRNEINEVDCDFTLMTAEACAAFCGLHRPALDPVHVIESGPVRTVIEAVFRCRDSAVVTQYVFPAVGNEIEVRLRVLFAEKDRMLKLRIPTRLKERYVGQTMFGTDELFTDGTECVSQKWTAVLGGGRGLALLNDGVYGSSCTNGEIRVSLLRSPAYTGHPIEDREILPQDRFTPRADQGERLYVFRMEGGDADVRLARVSRGADVLNEQPFILSFFPNAEEKTSRAPLCTVSGESVILTALRQAADGNGWILRLFAPSGRPETATLRIPEAGIASTMCFAPFEIRTLRYLPETGRLEEAHILS